MRRKEGLLSWILLLILLYTLSLVRVSWRREKLHKLRETHPPGTSLHLKGTVVSLPVEGKGSFRFLLKTPFLVEVRLKGDHPKPGDLIRIWGRVSPMDTFKNPWGLKRTAWYTQRGVAFPLYAWNWDLLKARYLPFYRQAPLDFASWGISRFKRDLGPRAGPVVSSLVLGFRQGLDWETRQLFTSTGLGHLLAISGFHMGVVFFFIYTMIRLILKTYALLIPHPTMDRLPSQRALLPSLLLLFFYLLATGAPPSAQRAFIMIASWVLARFWARDRSLEGALILAFMVMTLINPLVILQVGFQLTFAAMLGVVAVLRWIEPLEGKKAALVGYLAMALVIPLFTLPLILFHFHRLSPYSPLANLLLVFPAALVVTLGLLHLILAPLSLQAWLIPLEKGLINLFIGGLTLISRLPGASLWVTRREALFLSILVITGMAGIILARKGKRWALALPLVAFPLLLIPSPRGILVLDMGKQGRTLLFRGEKTVLIDPGTLGGRGAWSSLRNALLWMDTHSLDAIIVSRTIHSRASLAPRIMENFRVKGLYIPARGENPGMEKALLDGAREEGIPVIRVKAPLTISALSLLPRGSKRLEVKIDPPGLRETRQGWMWLGKLLKPWDRGAVTIPETRDPHHGMPHPRWPRRIRGTRQGQRPGP